ncbi:MAG TPA: cytochrome c oxidase subunit 3 [Candidatus Acidoferrales bacterium]|nr:cytochrome c oxidase subunit 3 [Candidatus Acidoferrales bacterium]
MSTTLTSSMPPPVRRQEVSLVIDGGRGTAGMLLFVATESFLFVLMFFAYFYLAEGGWRWLDFSPPSLLLPTVMMAVLIVSAFVAAWGNNRAKARETRSMRGALAANILLGLLFLALQGLSYAESWPHLTPQSNVYGSLFYTITIIHAAHIIIGVLMLAYALTLPRLEPTATLPHRPYRNATIYWYFCIVAFACVYGLLYVLPNIR